MQAFGPEEPAMFSAFSDISSIFCQKRQHSPSPSKSGKDCALPFLACYGTISPFPEPRLFVGAGSNTKERSFL
jgi:hypothetical protein